MSTEKTAPELIQGQQVTATSSTVSKLSQVSNKTKIVLTIAGLFILMSSLVAFAGENPIQKAQFELDNQAKLVQKLELSLSNAKVVLAEKEQTLATAKLLVLQDQKLGMLTPADLAEAERLQAKIQPLIIEDSKK